MLSKCMLEANNMLILDEPTAHLDLESITSLNNGLIKYDSELLFSSQDHQFVSTIANRIIEILPNGVIDRRLPYDEYLENKEVIKLSHLYIDFIDEDLFKLLSETYNKDLFIYKDKNTYGFINSKDNIEIDAIYDNIKYITDDYPIVLVKYSNELLLVNLALGKELPIKIKSDNIKVKSNYIVIDNDYYNYSGKLIYTVK